MVVIISIILICIVLFILVVAHVLQDRIIFPMVGINTPSNIPIAELLERNIDSIRIQGWYRKIPHERGLVVIFHGNGETIDGYYPIIEKYNDMGYSVLVPEYRGYGRSGGFPTVDAISEDVTYFIDTVGYSGDLVYHGISIGGGLASATCLNKSPDILILQSTFTSLGDLASDFYIPSFLLKQSMNTLGVLESIDSRVFIIHGESDSLISLKHAMKLQRYAEDRYFIPNGGHNLAMDSKFWQKIDSFIR